MTTYLTLSCATRTEIGSNAARQLRHQGMLPATVYGHGAPLSLKMDRHRFSVLEHASKSGSQIVILEIDGVESGMVLVKKVQRDMLKMTPLHVDLQRISLSEELQVVVSLIPEGEPIGIKEGGMLELVLHSLHIRCAADKVPDSISYDVSSMDIGDTIEAGAITLPAGCTLLDRPEECVALIRQPLRVSEEVVADNTAAVAETTEA